MSNDMEQYDRFVDASPQGALFHKSWWLDAVAPDSHTILSVKKNGEISAAWPLAFKKLAFANLIVSPQLTPRLGILFAPQREMKYAEYLSDEMRLASELVRLLPDYSYFCQRFSAEFTNWLPLYWSGFRQTTRYTYVIEDLSDIDKVWENMRYGTKRKIKTARNHGIRVVSDLGLEKLLDLNEMTYRRQKLSPPCSRGYIRRIDDACLKNHAGKMFFAVDPLGRIHAAVYIVYDQKAAYYLLGGADPSLNHCGAHFLALWEAIQYAGRVSRSFDFEGSMHSSIEPVFRGFGGIQKPYMEISGGSPLLESAFAVFRYFWNKGGIASAVCSRFLQS